MASAEKRFTELLDACLILAKSTKRNITKMEADIISKSPSAINKLSLLPVDTTTSFSCKKFLEAGPASKTPQSVSSTESQTLLWLSIAGWPSLNPEAHACQPRGQTGSAPQEESSAANSAFWSISHFLTPLRVVYFSSWECWFPDANNMGCIPLTVFQIHAAPVTTARSSRVALNFSHKGQDLEGTSQMCWSFSKFIKLLLSESTTAVKRTETPSFIKTTQFWIWDSPEFKTHNSHLLDMSAWESSLSLSFPTFKIELTVLPSR